MGGELSADSEARGQSLSRFGLDIALSHPVLGWHPQCEDLESAPGHSQPSTMGTQQLPGRALGGPTPGWDGLLPGRTLGISPSSSFKCQNKQWHLCWGWGQQASLTASRWGERSWDSGHYLLADLGQVT